MFQWILTNTYPFNHRPNQENRTFPSPQKGPSCPSLVIPVPRTLPSPRTGCAALKPHVSGILQHALLLPSAWTRISVRARHGMDLRFVSSLRLSGVKLWIFFSSFLLRYKAHTMKFTALAFSSVQGSRVTHIHTVKHPELPLLQIWNSTH